LVFSIATNATFVSEQYDKRGDMKRLKCLVLSLAIFTLFCSGTVFAEKVYKHSAATNTVSLDPTKASDPTALDIGCIIFDTLYQYKYLAEPVQVEPNLAASMPVVSEDGRVYTITIKKGAVFADDVAFSGGKGREVVAKDFVYSIKRHFDKQNNSYTAYLWKGRIVGMKSWSEQGAKYDSMVEGLKATGKYTIQIKLTHPFPGLIYTLTEAPSGVVAREVVEHYGRGIGLHPVGSGPFKLKSFNAHKAVLIKNPSYRKEILTLDAYDEKIHGKYQIKNLKGKRLPMVDKIEYYFFKEKTTLWNSFKKGNEIQWTYAPAMMFNDVLNSRDPISLKPKFEKKYHFRIASYGGWGAFLFNMVAPSIGYHKDPARNKRNLALRHAMRKGFNWDMYGKRFFGGVYTKDPGFLTDVIPGYDKNASRESVTYDPKGAIKLLKENGWTRDNLPVIEYAYIANAEERQKYEMFKGLMKKIGIPKNKFKSRVFANLGDWAGALYKGELMVTMTGTHANNPDPESTMRLVWSGNIGGSNTISYKNAEYDRLYKIMSRSQPSAKRNKMVARMNQILVDDCAMVGSIEAPSLYMWHKDVKFYFQLRNHHILKYVYVD